MATALLLGRDSSGLLRVDRESERIDYDEVRRLALAERPKLIICGASAYSRVIDFARFRAIADEAAPPHATSPHRRPGAAGLHPRRSGTATSSHHHHKTLRGRAGMVMCEEAFAKDIDRSVFPGIQAAPDAHHRAKAWRSGRRSRRVRVYQGRSSPMQGGSRAADGGKGAVSRAAPTTTSSSWMSPRPG